MPLLSRSRGRLQTSTVCARPHDHPWFKTYGSRVGARELKEILSQRLSLACSLFAVANCKAISKQSACGHHSDSIPPTYRGSVFEHAQLGLGTWQRFGTVAESLPSCVETSGLTNQLFLAILDQGPLPNKTKPRYTGFTCGRAKQAQCHQQC